MIRTLTTTLLATAAIASASSPELRATAQKLSDAHSASVVWLSVIAKTTMSVDGEAPAQVKAALQGQDKESKTEVTGTIVDPSGLIVTALGKLDQSSIINGKTVNTPMGAIKLKAKSDIKEVKVIMPDGSEIPADLVMKDADLGLAFIRVRADSDEAKGVKFPAIDLKDADKGKVLDECIALGRLDESMSREASISTEEITAMTTKPRVFYRAGGDSIGTPIFLANGKLLGISVVRNPKGGDAGDGQISLSPVVLPAADVEKVAIQAKAAKPVENKEGE